MTNVRIHKGDKVMIITGKDAGKIGKVLKVIRKHDQVLVEKANVAKRHTRANPYTCQPGGIVEKAMPVHISNVMIVCSACAEATKLATGMWSRRTASRKSALLQEVQRSHGVSGSYDPPRKNI